MTTLDTEWTAHARRLADALRDNGDLRSRQWHSAVSEVPRHLLVPLAYEQDRTGEWVEIDTAADLARAYSPETLVTALARTGDHEEPISSSTKPDLMVRMLEILDVRDGQKVLEIGTGTGYNAALLAHRLGDDRVFSVDVGEDLVDVARERLAAAGYRPLLVAADGAAGLAEHAPFDRIIATCSVPRVPWTWAEQLAPDGAILVDVKLAVSAGNLVHLHRVGDKLEGHFTSRWAAFMAMRPGTPTIPSAQPANRATGSRTRPTDAPAAPWNDAPVAWFLAQLKLPGGLSFGYELDPETMQPAAVTLSAPDGSWARAALTGSTVTEGGTPLWSSIEWAHDLWTSAGRPGWDRLGLTVEPTGEHTIWIDHPASEHHWRLS
ncbi:methyltransferase domain-containing protein [Amycolatopsis sp. CFH S0078]|uniref:methyltransferase domain-containing protein n=1 Tax=Amycolatopsis sp. CFH S0078 TaxID=1644108 RepID=UPI001F0E1968|nr:methyltransferase domain-containing protein [Amycolatopsis sp. CFH S0078]